LCAHFSIFQQVLGLLSALDHLIAYDILKLSFRAAYRWMRSVALPVPRNESLTVERSLNVSRIQVSREINGGEKGLPCFASGKP
jgi:hypothetical protein